MKFTNADVLREMYRFYTTYSILNRLLSERQHDPNGFKELKSYLNGLLVLPDQFYAVMNGVGFTVIQNKIGRAKLSEIVDIYSIDGKYVLLANVDYYDAQEWTRIETELSRAPEKEFVEAMVAESYVAGLKNQECIESKTIVGNDSIDTYILLKEEDEKKLSCSLISSVDRVSEEANIFRLYLPDAAGGDEPVITVGLESLEQISNCVENNIAIPRDILEREIERAKGTLESVRNYGRWLTTLKTNVQIEKSRMEVAAETTIKEWYHEHYESDELCSELKEGTTFYDLHEAVEHNKDIYEVIGEEDSTIRERLFQGLADMLGVEYDYVYSKWLSE